MEGLTNINSNLLPNEIKQIYDHCVWNEYDELNIQLFEDLLQQRCKNIKIKNIKDITLKFIIKYAFPLIFIEDKSVGSNDSESSKEINLKSSTIWNNNNDESPLNKIHDILNEKDDDNNLCIDWSEFQEAMDDLGVKLSQQDLQIIYTILIKQQYHENNNNNNNSKELNIKQFMLKLSKLKGVKSMKPNQILQQYFNPLIPKNCYLSSSKKHYHSYSNLHHKKYKNKNKNKNKKRGKGYTPENQFTFIDYDTNHFQKGHHSRSKTSTKFSSSRSKGNSSLNDIEDLDPFRKIKKQKKIKN